jgi:hypothetical protein
MRALFVLAVLTAPLPPGSARVYPVNIRDLVVLKRDSGPISYYQTVGQGPDAFIHADYRPPLQTVTLFDPLPDQFRRGVRRFRWRWRALVLPVHGNECAEGLGDSAAAVYITWKSGLRWYSLKFIWSTEAKVGQTCAKKRNPFVFQDSIILHSGKTSAEWVQEEVDPAWLFQKHFIDTGETDSYPEFQGFGILTDGDQTNSESSADYAAFELLK